MNGFAAHPGSPRLPEKSWKIPAADGENVMRSDPVNANELSKEMNWRTKGSPFEVSADRLKAKSERLEAVAELGFASVKSWAPQKFDASEKSPVTIAARDPLLPVIPAVTVTVPPPVHEPV